MAIIIHAGNKELRVKGLKLKPTHDDIMNFQQHYTKEPPKIKINSRQYCLVQTKKNGMTETTDRFKISGVRYLVASHPSPFSLAGFIVVGMQSTKAPKVEIT